MTKTDKSKHNICIAAIRRKLMKPYDFKWTRFYESNADFPYSGLQLQLAEAELLICSTVIDAGNYSILTTRRLITSQDGQECTGYIAGARDKPYHNFKMERDRLFTFGKVQLYNGALLNYFIEAGRASMIMIYGVTTLIGLSSKGEL